MIRKKWCATCKDIVLHKVVSSFTNGLAVVSEPQCLACQAKRDQAERGPIRYGPDPHTSIGSLPPAG